jgi:hypothetical protein
VKNLLLTAVCLFAVAACDKPSSPSTDPKADDPAAKNTTATATTAAAPTTATPQPVAIDDSVLATPADFEESAQKTITAKTYKTALATLETEVAKD